MRKTPRVKASFFFKLLWFGFFGLTHRVKNYPTNEIGAFAHTSGAAEVTVKHNLGALKHKTVSFFSISSSLELLELEHLLLEISMFSLYDFDKRVNTCSLLLSDKRVSVA